MIVVAAVLVVVLTMGSTSTKQPVNWRTATGVKAYGGLGPEGIPLELGLPLGSPNAGLTNSNVDGVGCSSSEQLAYHHHVHLAIFVDGQPRPMPPGVGMVAPVSLSKTSAGDFAAGSSVCLFWLHVHAQDGIVHVESPEVRTFYLGQLFGIWHLALSANQLGTTKGPVTITVDGHTWAGDPTQVPLDEHSEIVINVGTPAVTPPPISWANTGL